MTRTVFHIGAPKSGTTHIQALLWTNRPLLESAGIRLPGKRQTDQFNIGRDIRQKPPEPDHPHGNWTGTFDKAVSRFEKSGLDTLLFTDERLAGADRASVEKAMDRVGGDIEVVYGMRDFAGVLTSSWQERVKDTVDRPFPEWLRIMQQHNENHYFWRMHDVPAVLERWSLGWQVPVRILALPGPGSSRDELWFRFKNILGWEAETNDEVPRANESIGFVEANLLSRVQAEMSTKGHLPRRHHVMKHDVAARVLSTREPQRPILIPEEFRGWVLEEGARRRAVLDNANVELVGEMSEIEETDRRFGEQSIDDYQPELLADAVAVIAGLVDELAKERSSGALERGVKRLAGAGAAEQPLTADKVKSRLSRLVPGKE